MNINIPADLLPRFKDWVSNALPDFDIEEFHELGSSEPIMLLVQTRQPSILCPQCNRRSWHPEDILQRYCGACHEFHETMGQPR